MKDRAVRMMAEIRSEHGSEWSAVESVAQKLGIGTAQTAQNMDGNAADLTRRIPALHADS